MLGPTLDGTIGDQASEYVDGWWSRKITGPGTVAPDGAIDVLWSACRAPWIAGPDTAPRTVGLAAGTQIVSVRLKPCVAPAVLNDSVEQAADRSVPLEQVWPGHVVRELDDSLQVAPTAFAAARLLAHAVASQIDPNWRPDPVVLDSLAVIRSGGGAPDSRLSERQFRRRFRRSLGYGHAFYRRVVRLDAFAELAAEYPRRSIAELAAQVGYFDESHLARDAVALTGMTPAVMRAA